MDAMDRNEFEAFLRSVSFPPDEIGTLCADFSRLRANGSARALLEKYASLYRAGSRFSFGDATEELRPEAEKCGVHPYTSDLLFYLYLAPALRDFYREKGYPDDMFAGVIDDLVCKLTECKKVFGVSGSFVACWFSRFFTFSLFALGRLEFCLTPCPADFRDGDRFLPKGALCIDVHIPSKGRLTREALDDAYGRAARLFAAQLEGPVVFHCHSWLLFREHETMLPEGSGIRVFLSDYTRIADVGPEGDLWRIFDGYDTDKPESLPEDTALRKAYKDRLTRGLPVGGGEGLFFYDALPGRSKQKGN